MDALLHSVHICVLRFIFHRFFRFVINEQILQMPGKEMSKFRGNAQNHFVNAGTDYCGNHHPVDEAY